MTNKHLSSSRSLGKSRLNLEALENRILLSSDLPSGFELLGYIDPGELNLSNIFGAEINEQGDLIISGNCSIYSSDYGTFALHGDQPGSYESFIANVDLNKIKADWINFQSNAGDLILESDGSIRPSTYSLFSSDGYLDWSFDWDISDNSGYDSATTSGVQYRIQDTACYDTINQNPYGFGVRTEYIALVKIQVQSNPTAYEWQTPAGETILHEDSSGSITFALTVAPGNDPSFSYLNNNTVWFNDTAAVKKVSDGYRKIERYNATFSIDTDTGTPSEATVFDYYWSDFNPFDVELLQMNATDELTIFNNDEIVYRLTTDGITPVGSKDIPGDSYTFGRDGFIYLTGMLNSDLYLAKYDTAGNKIWAQTFGGSSDEMGYPFEVGVDNDGNVTVLGRTSSSDLTLVDPLYTEFNGYDQHFIARFDSSGSLKFSTYVPDLNVEHSGWGTVTMSPNYMAVEPDGDVIMGYTSSYIYKSRIVRMDNVSAPSGSLADNYDEVGYVYTDEINEKGYLDLALNGAAKSSVTGDELVLSGEGAQSVSVKGKPTLIDAANSIYRYMLTGEFSGGPVTVNIPAGTFENDRGIANVATTTNFDSFPTLTLLETDKTPADFTWDSADQRFEYTGTISIGPGSSLTGGTLSPLITVNGELALDAEKLSATGTVTTTATGSSQGVFNGSFEILLNKDETYVLDDNDSTVSAEISLAGLDLRYRSMKLTAENGTRKLLLQGDIKLPDEFGFNAITMTGSQYLELTSAGQTLTGATMALEDIEIDLEYLNLTAEQMSIEYIVAAGTQPEALRFRGKVILPEVFNATADFTTDTFAGTDGYIEINANGEIKWYGKLSVEEIVIVEDRWVIKQASLEVRDVPGVGMSVQGDGIFTVPPGMDIICGLGFVNEELNYVRLGVDEIELPIGTTGAFLQSINGYVNNIADPDATKIQFGGGLGFTAGKKIELSLPDWAGGDLEGALAEFGVEGGFTFQELTGSGTVKVAGGLAEGAATATLNWEKNTLNAQCQLTALNNLLGINGAMKADSNMNISINGTGTVGIPTIIPIWGGKSLANGTTVLNFTNDDNYTNDYIAGWGSTSITAFGKVYSMTAGIRVNFDGSYSFLGGKTAARLQAGQTSPLLSDEVVNKKSIESDPIEDTAYTNSETFYATEGQEWLMINAQWDNAAAGEISLTDPNGVVYDLAAITNSDFIAVVPELSDDTTTTLFIESPTPGTWTLQVASDEPLEGLTFDGYQDTTLPQLTIDEISINPYSQSGAIAYSGDSDLTGCQITFYYDDDHSGADGILMGQADNTGQFDWDTSSVAAGAYYVYGLISDGNNIPTASYYDEPIEIEASQALTDILIGTGAAGRISYTDADNTLVTVSLKGDSGTLRFTGDDITATGTKNVVVTGTNLFLQSIVLDGTGIAALSIGAKGGSDNEATIGAITGGEIKSLSGKGVVLAGNLQTSGSLSTLSWGDLGDNITIETGQSGSGFSLKAGNIGDNVTFDIADSIKSFSANTYASGRVDCDSLGKFAIKSGLVEVDITADSGDIGSVGSSGDLLGSLTAAGEIKAVAVKAGALKASLTASGAIGKVSALTIEGATLNARSVGSIAGKGDILDLTLVTTGGDIKSIKAAGDIDLQASIAGSFGSLGTKGDLSGVIRAENMISGVSAGSMSAILSAGGNIGKVSLKGDMTDSWLMAGLDLGSDLVFSSDDAGSGGDIGSVAVSGVFASSYLLAGALPEVSLIANSALSAPWFAPTGAIGSVKFGQINYTNDEPFGLFAATAIKPFKVGNVLVESQEMLKVTIGG